MVTRRLHRLQALHSLESESEVTGIKYPRADSHKKRMEKTKPTDPG